MTMKTTSVKEKYMTNFSNSSSERASTNEGGSPLPPQPSREGLKKGSDEKILKNPLAPSLKRRKK
jgi:hypothetical protein